jgi:purine nucleosidase/pyrimidine-specific ribonucleoside hydrolase
VIFDDDGSPDGTTALLYLLSRPDVSIQSVSISYGEAYPEVYIQHIGRILDEFGRTDIPLGAGQAAPLAGDHAFPEWMRESANSFWGLPVPNAGKTYPAQDAAELMVAVIGQSPERVTVFVSGPATNLAQALRLDPGIRAQIAAVIVMGGAVGVPGNIAGLLPNTDNEVAEWNIYADPLAARELFESGLTVTLVPLDATNQVSVSRDDTSQWRQGGEIADLAADTYDAVLERWGAESAEVWDVMTAAIAVQPGLCGFQALPLQVVTDEGPTSGQTVVVAGAATNAQVCLEPNAEAIRQSMIDVFSSQR